MELLLSLLKAFLVGGLICVPAQIMIDRTALTPARILTGYVVAGVILGALGIFDPLKEFAGSGACVPLIGFGNLIAQGTREAVEQEGVLGIFTGGLKAAAGGICASLVFGFVCALLFRAKPKK